MGGSAPVIEARGLLKRYGSQQALAGVSLSAGRGELVAIAGPNGAGKTTLLSVLAGAQRPDAGTVSRAPSEIGWVPQQPSLYSKLTVAENLRLFARLEGVENVARTVADMIGQAGLAERADDPVAELSHGNRQRVNIAIGVLASPPVLLLDEPSAGLDPRQRGRLWEFVAGLAAERGTAVIYSTHDVREVEHHAHRVLAVADGELIFGGSPRELRELVGREDADLESAFVAFLEARGH